MQGIHDEPPANGTQAEGNGEARAQPTRRFNLGHPAIREAQKLLAGELRGVAISNRNGLREAIINDVVSMLPGMHMRVVAESYGVRGAEPDFELPDVKQRIAARLILAAHDLHETPDRAFVEAALPALTRQPAGGR